MMMFFNKGIEMAAEGIPGCVLQCFVLFSNPSLRSDWGAIVSILVSALTTGINATMIAYDVDTDEPHRVVQPKFYGYIKDGNRKRGQTFLLMTLISTLHSLSRSIGYGILCVQSKTLALRFFVVEVGAYLLYKIARRDFWWWGRVKGVLAVVLALSDRILVKTITDFTGERAKRASFEEDESTSHYQLHSFCSLASPCFIKNAHNLASLGARLRPFSPPVRAGRGSFQLVDALGANYAVRRVGVV